MYGPFVGRFDDISHVGMDLIEQILIIFDNYGFDTDTLLRASETPSVVDAALKAPMLLQFHIVYDSACQTPLTDIGIKRFLEDWEKVPKKDWRLRLRNAHLRIYRCNKCSNDFEKLVFSTTAAVCCPECSSDKVVKRISLFGMRGGSESDSVFSDSSSAAVAHQTTAQTAINYG